MLRLAIVEDDSLVRDSLNSYFNTTDDIEVVCNSSSVEHFISSNDFNTPLSTILLDINLEGMSGIEGIPLILDKWPNLNIVMLTTFEDNDSIFKCLSAGATSYISKQASLNEIREALITVNQGGSYMSPAIARKVVNHFSQRSKSSILTDRQKEIVDGIVKGKSYKMIATDLFVSIDTVRSHIKNIYKLLKINSKAELIRKSFNGEL